MFSKVQVGLAVGFGLWITAGSVLAQQPCTTTCPTSVAGAPGPKFLKTGDVVHPWLQKHHDRNMVYPTICPGSCFGYFRASWTPWEQACPNWCGNQSSVVVGPAVSALPMTTPPTPVMPAPAPKTLPPMAPPAPEREPAKESSKAPMEDAPKPATSTPVSVPGNSPGLTLPPVPDLQIGVPPAPPVADPAKS